MNWSVPSMRFVSRSECRSRFEGKSVAIVGSGPSCAENTEGFIDSHDVVVRVNNYRLIGGTGARTDVFYSFFGTSIKKTTDELKRDGVTLCMGKLPNADISGWLSHEETAWHRGNGKAIGLDYRPHYERRSGWWFCDGYIPSIDDFMAKFELLGRRQPTTGFAAILDVLSFDPRSVFLTGFDFFRSGIHNVNEPWRKKNLDDPIRHDPEREFALVSQAFAARRVACDASMQKMFAG